MSIATCWLIVVSRREVFENEVTDMTIASFTRRNTRLDLEISDTQWNWIVTRHRRCRNVRRES